MVKCPSKFCNCENPENAFRCNECGIRLDLPEGELKARDMLFDIFKQFSDKFGPEFELTRELVDTIVERHGATMLFVFIQSMKGEDDVQQPEKFPKGLYSIFIDRLKKLETGKGRVIRFPRVFECICTNFKMTKEECWDILFMLNEFKIVELVPYHGIRLLY